MLYGNAQYIKQKLITTIGYAVMAQWCFVPELERVMFVEELMRSINFGYLDTYVGDRSYASLEIIKGRVNYSKIAAESAEAIKETYLRIRNNTYWPPKRTKDLVLIIEKFLKTFEKERVKNVRTANDNT